jgi:DNA transposition AAA+ family ATPase
LAQEAAAGLGGMVRRMAQAVGVSPDSNTASLVDRIKRALTPDMLLILDELHLLAYTYRRSSFFACLEVIREIYDEVHCGMVLCGTNIARDEIESGQHKELLAQLRRRGIFRLQLPAYAPWADRLAIAKHFGLVEAPEGGTRELVDEIIRKNGLKAYTSYLQAASRISIKRKVAIEWKHFVTAHDVIARLSVTTAEEEE